MDLGCIDMGCIEKQRKETSLDRENSRNEPGTSSAKLGKNKGSKDVLQPSLSVLNKLTSQITKPQHRRTSPLNWFPRKKTESYLNRKIKLLQEVDGMNSTLDETLGDSNPHYCRVLREKMAIREAAEKAMEAQKAAMVEASWCRILKAARIESKDAETELSKAEKLAVEAFEAATAIGVIMNDIPDCAKKRYEMENVSFKGGESSTHRISATFETAFEVDKQVAAAVKAAFIKLANCPSINKDEFRELLLKISETPDTGETCHELSEFSSEYESDNSSSQNVSRDKEFETERKRKYKTRQVLEKFNRANLVEMMLRRLRCLKEDELSSLATIVATSGLNEALLEAENDKQYAINSSSIDDNVRPNILNTDLDRQAEAQLPSLDKFLVKHLTRLERELLEAKKAGKNEATDGNEQDLYGKSEHEKLSFVNDTRDSENFVHKPSCVIEEKTLAELPSLDTFLVKHLTRLERELLEAKREQVVNSNSNDENLSSVENSSSNKNEGKNGEGTEVQDLGSVLVKHSSKLEKEIEDAKMKNGKESNRNDKKLESASKNANATTEIPSLDKYLVKHMSKLEREVQEARNTKGISCTDGDLIGKENMDLNLRKQVGNCATDYESLDKVLVKYVSRLEKEKMGLSEEEMKPKRRNTNREANSSESSLDQVLVKHKSRLEREKMAAVAAEQNSANDQIKHSVSRQQAREKELQETWGGMSLGNSMRPHVSRLERDKDNVDDDRQIRHSVSRRQAREKELHEAWGGLSLGNSMQPHVSRLEREKDSVDDYHQIRHSVSRRQARERGLQEAWGGLSLGNSMRPHVSRLERDKAAWLKAEEEEKASGTLEVSGMEILSKETTLLVARSSSCGLENLGLFLNISLNSKMIHNYISFPPCMCESKFHLPLIVNEFVQQI